MNKYSKAISISVIILIFLFSLGSNTQAQVRGKSLYKKLTNDKNLVKFEGLSRLNWTPDGKYYYIFKDKTFKKTEAVSGKESSLFNNSVLIKAYNTITSKNIEELPFRHVTFIDKGNKIQFMVKNTAYIYDLKTLHIISYVPEKEFTGVRGRSYSEVFSPDFKYRAFIRNYNIFIQDLEGKETALTKNGHKDLRNGFPDWVYPEELGQYKAFWWSPDSKNIAFMQFDESPVTKYPIVHDVDPKPEYEMQSYPKAGANNPIVRFFVVNIKTKKITRIETGLETNVYLYKGQWTPAFAANPETGYARIILTDKDKCYVTPNDVIFLKDKEQFLWTSERSGWKEIYLYDLKGNMVKQLTETKLPVRRILGLDEENGWVYFSGSENRGLESSAFRVKLNGTRLEKLTKGTGSHSISLSPEANFYTDSFSSFSSPRKATLHHANGKLIRELGNTVISQEFKDFKLINPEHFVFKSADGKYDLDGIMYKPAHFEGSCSVRLYYPIY